MPSNHKTVIDRSTAGYASHVERSAPVPIPTPKPRDLSYERNRLKKIERQALQDSWSFSTPRSQIPSTPEHTDASEPSPESQPVEDVVTTRLASPPNRPAPASLLDGSAPANEPSTKQCGSLLAPPVRYSISSLQSLYSAATRSITSIWEATDNSTSKRDDSENLEEFMPREEAITRGALLWGSMPFSHDRLRRDCALAKPTPRKGVRGGVVDDAKIREWGGSNGMYWEQAGELPWEESEREWSTF